MTEENKKNINSEKFPPPQKLKVDLNLSHSEYLLRKLGLLSNDESLSTLQDSVKIKRITDEFTLNKDPNTQTIVGIALNWDEVRRRLTPSFEIKQEEALNPLLRVKRQREEYELLFTIHQELAQNNTVSSCLHTFTKLLAMPALEARNRSFFESSLNKFSMFYPNLQSTVQLLEQVVEAINERIVTKQTTVEDNEMHRKEANANVSSTEQDGEVEFGINARRTLAILKDSLKSAHEFLADTAKIADLRDKASSLGLNLPNIFIIKSTTTPN